MTAGRLHRLLTRRGWRVEGLGDQLRLTSPDGQHLLIARDEPADQVLGRLRRLGFEARLRVEAAGRP